MVPARGWGGWWLGVGGCKRPADMSLLHTVLITQLVYISGGKSAAARNAVTEGDGKKGSASFMRIIFSRASCAAPICVKALRLCVCVRARVRVLERESDAPKCMCNLRFRW